jgi:hypothetical protein
MAERNRRKNRTAAMPIRENVTTISILNLPGERAGNRLSLRLAVQLDSVAPKSEIKSGLRVAKSALEKGRRTAGSSEANPARSQGIYMGRNRENNAPWI